MEAHSAKRVASAVLLLASGCFLARSTRPDTGSPATAIRLSEVIAQLSQNAEVREKLLQSLDSLPNAWGLIGDNQRARLRDYILNRNWSGIDHFPGLTVAELRASVSVANAAASNYPAVSNKLSPPYVEVGPFSAGAPGEVEWQAPAESRNVLAPPLKVLGFDLIMGDAPNPELWKWHAQSERAAYLLNRLNLNSSHDQAHVLRVRIDNQTADSPASLLSLLEHSGYEVSIEDARYFANFGHLHFKGQDVVMPFWLNTRLRVPNTKQDLLVPVSHAEEEIRIRSRKGNADVSFYYGIDGMAEFRTMDTLDQDWVGKNVAHTYQHAHAVEVAHLLSEAVNTYAVLHRRYPNLPFNGYYRLGVCQDVVAAIEHQMNGKVTLFPITHDPGYSKAKTEMDRLFGEIPNDRNNRGIEWSRIRGSLPARNLADIRLPELRRELELVDQSQNEKRRGIGWITIAAALILVCFLAAAVYRHRARIKR